MAKRKGGEEGGRGGKSDNEDRKRRESKLEKIKDKELGVLAATVLCLKRGCSANGPEVVIGPTVFRLCENRRPCENRQMNLLDLTKGEEKRHGGKPRDGPSGQIVLATKGGNGERTSAEKKTEKRQTHNKSSNSRKKKGKELNVGINILSFAGDGTTQKGAEGGRKEIQIAVQKKPVDVLTQKAVKPSVDGEKDKRKSVQKGIVKLVEDGGSEAIVRTKTHRAETTSDGKRAAEGEKDQALRRAPQEEVDRSKKTTTVEAKATAERRTADRNEPEIEPISLRQLVEPAEKVLGIDGKTAERILATALGYLTKYPSVGDLRFIDDISKLSKTAPDLVKKLLLVLRAYDVVEVHEMGVVNLKRPVADIAETVHL